jgi:hypothetical protein
MFYTGDGMFNVYLISSLIVAILTLYQCFMAVNGLSSYAKQSRTRQNEKALKLKLTERVEEIRIPVSLASNQSETEKLTSFEIDSVSFNENTSFIAQICLVSLAAYLLLRVGRRLRI